MTNLMAGLVFAVILLGSGIMIIGLLGEESKTNLKMGLTFAVLLFLASGLFGQSISGVDRANPGQLIILKPADVGKARTLWLINYPDEFEQWQTENGKLFIAMPGHRVSFTLIITPDDVSEPLRQIRHTIDVASEVKPNPPDVVDPVPVEPVDPPIDFRSSPLFSVAAKAYKAVEDTDKAIWAKQMAAAFAHINEGIRSGKYPEVSSMMNAVSAANNGRLGLAGSKPWPEKSRKQWRGFRDSIADALMDLDLAGKLGSTNDYVVHWEAIRQALLEEVNSGRKTT